MHYLAPSFLRQYRVQGNAAFNMISPEVDGGKPRWPASARISPRQLKMEISKVKESPPIRVPSMGDTYPNVVGRTTRFHAEIGFLIRFFWLTRWLPRRSGHGGCLADPVRVLFNIYTRLQHFLGGTPPCPSTNPFITPSQCSCCVRRYQH